MNQVLLRLRLRMRGLAKGGPVGHHLEIFRRLGFETRNAKCQGEMGMKENEEPSEKESGSIFEMVSAITREVPERGWERVPADLSKNVDHYLYGSKRTEE